MDIYRAEREVKWFVFDTEKQGLFKILENTVDHPKGTCPQYPYFPASWYGQGDTIFMRFSGTASPYCGTMMIDTTTDTFSPVKDVPPAIERGLQLFKNSSFFNQSPTLRYADHTFTRSTSGTGYDIVDATGKKTGHITVPVLSVLFPTMQYGDSLYTD